MGAVLNVGSQLTKCVQGNSRTRVSTPDNAQLNQQVIDQGQ